MALEYRVDYGGKISRFKINVSFFNTYKKVEDIDKDLK